MRQVIDSQINNLKTQAANYGQETRVSIYKFGKTRQLLYWELHPSLIPSASLFYNADLGSTGLIDATGATVTDLSTIFKSKGEDHSFLLYVETDGEETDNKAGGSALKKRLDDLPDEWTVAVTVPNITAKHNAKSYGFPADNIEIWQTTEVGLEEVTQKINFATTSYYTQRAAGIKGTKCLFRLQEVAKTEVKKTLTEVNPGLYDTLIVRKYDDGKAIKDFVEAWTQKPYRVGSSYYQLTKPEKIQAGKVVAVIEKATGKMYSGPEARQLLGLPDYEVKVEAASFKTFDVFIQSHSTNRKLVKDTHLVVFK